VLYPHVVLYERVLVGRGCIIHSGAVIGADGFGFTRDEGKNRKIPQVGGVVIGDDVEVGANTCIDAGTMTPTRVGTNTKIDNLVQIGHNVEIGERVILCGGVSIAGSAKIEDDVTLAGQAGVAGHITVGRGSTVAAGSGVISDVESGAVVSGMPHMPLEEWRRAYAALRRLPDLQHELRELRRRVEDLQRPR
jgi:UDP-3-O-[3-hydroxymyristoyl] glucosamine N-acyltransferase